MPRRNRKRKLADPREAGEESLMPTDQRFAKGTAARSTRAFRFEAPIRTLFEQDKLSPSQFDNLDYYRQQSQQAQDEECNVSPMHPEKSMGGGGKTCVGVMPASLLKSSSAQIETARIERDILEYGQGALEFVRFVVRDEQSLAQWCVHKFGGRERLDARGKVIAIVPVAEKRVMKESLATLKYLAGVIRR